MPIPARLLRAQVDDLPGARLRLSAREQEQQDRIVAAGTALMARFGRAALSMHTFAIALRMAPASIRRHFPDLDSLLAEILYRHLRAISEAIGSAPSHPGFDAANPNAARRAAYLRATRTGFNAPTEPHLLLMRERHALPADLAGPIEELRLGIGTMLTGGHAEIALSLLDTPYLQAAQIEAMLATLAGEPAAAIQRPIQFTPPPPPAKLPQDTPRRPKYRSRHGPH